MFAIIRLRIPVSLDRGVSTLEVVQELLEVVKAIGYQAFSRIIRELAPDILGAFIGAIVDIAIVKDGRYAYD
ncbi:hypothetical protein OA07_15725 [Aphanizomenon flos-aquae 2012/KM1/D3]|uniref:hypothetical protein n=1 Tax=Aphanizomenon flos-aquae TaxID=1176 RepID=UPI000542EBCB|nr:hypothetical protein [Aphanizomenon flos-aquae]KHG39909.1 hypothetical protein OA07_20775 [Aphanizomenon flos-aquae 2012/KM1/D3]KHG40735.1 hypothetical protein OA07_15725 [Aphanizomenon flos-aquae 2012/KM1/D3]